MGWELDENEYWQKVNIGNCWQPISKDLYSVYFWYAGTFKNLPRPFVGAAKLASSVQTRSKKFQKGERKAKFDLVHSNACSYCMERDWCSRTDEEQRNEEEDHTENRRLKLWQWRKERFICGGLSWDYRDIIWVANAMVGGVGATGRTQGGAPQSHQSDPKILPGGSSQWSKWTFWDGIIFLQREM